tara:strand:- start:13177 stop:13764 length:588 start_codon:yes stop_codon:yes gene_type:complete
MADVNNFGLKGIANLVQFGKRGLKLLTNTTDNEFTFTDNDGSTLVEVKGADATQATAFFTKGQFDSATQTVAQYVSTEVQYNSGTTTLFEAPADSMIFSISVDVGSPWVSADDTTTIIVGDDGDTDRHFGTGDADMTQTFQFQSSHQHIYSSATNVKATVAAGSASSGTAVITAIVLTQASVTSNITRDYGSVAS